MIKINDGVFLAVKRATKVVLDKPIAVGISIMEISKCYMYEFHYGHMVENYGDKARVLYGDTDSIVYLVETEDFYKDMVDKKNLFDMSGYEDMHANLNDQTNKKVLGKMKDEFPKGVIYRFAAAKPKMYGIRVIVMKDGVITFAVKKVVKGVKKSAIEHQIDLDQFDMVLETNVQTEVVIMALRSRLHTIYTEWSIKKALNGFDTKRRILDAVRTLAHGHKDSTL